MYYMFEKRDVPFQIFNDSFGLIPMPHIHPELELIYQMEGTSLASADGVTVPLEAGDIYLSFPNQIHYYLDQGPTQQHVCIVTADLFPELKKIFQTKVPLSPVVKKADLPRNTAELLRQIIRYYQENTKLSMAAADGYMQGLLAEVLRHMELTEVYGSSDSFKEILLYCIENYTELLTLDMLAKQLHLSKYYISHIFSDRLNLSFPEFINGLRVEHVCRHMRKGESITQAAFNAGFSSVRSFNRNFERVTGMTPSAYRNQKYTQISEERNENK